MSNYNNIKIPSLRRSQNDIIREFLLDEYTEFELSGSFLLDFGMPNKKTYQNIISLFKKRCHQNEIAQFCVGLNELYEEYKKYCADRLYNIPPLSRSQFSRSLSKMTLLNDLREVIIFRYSRKQIKYVFPLLKKKKT